MLRTCKLVTALLTLLAAGAALAQKGYPEKPIRLVTGYLAGGGSDFVTRTRRRSSASSGRAPSSSRTAPAAAPTSQPSSSRVQHPTATRCSLAAARTLRT